MNPMRMRPPTPVPAVPMDRRVFLKATAAAGAGLTLGIWAGPAPAQASGPGKTVGSAAAGAFEPNAFLTIGRDNVVTVIVKHLEMGQGTYTGLPTLVAEELDASWSQVRATGAPADAKLYSNLFWGGAQGTGGSTAMANSFEQYRQAGAAARAMLVSAAAKQWSVPADSIQVKNGVVFHANGKKATFGQLAAAAAREPVPEKVTLKDPKDFVYIGKHVPRIDAKAKSNGTATFTQDVKLPGMLTAVVAHPPRFGAKVKSFDGKDASAVPGVRHVVAVPNGVAVVATSFWAAKKGRDALKIEWDDATGFKQSSADILAEYKKLAATPGTVARNDGDAAKAIDGAAKKLEATYEFPYLAHAAMEPMNCVVKLDPTKCEVWNGEQFQTGDQFAVARITGLKPEQVKLNMLYAGGSFGRRANPAGDYVVEAAAIAKALAAPGKPGVPVKLVWTREDDMKGGLLPSSLRAHAEGGARCVGQRRRLAAAYRRTVDSRRHALRENDGQGRHRRDQRGRRVDAAVRDSESPGRPAFDVGRGAGVVVALGGLHAHRVFDRNFHRRTRGCRRQGSGRISPSNARAASTASGGARARGREVRLGHATRAWKGRGKARPRHRAP